MIEDDPARGGGSTGLAGGDAAWTPARSRLSAGTAPDTYGILSRFRPDPAVGP